MPVFPRAVRCCHPSSVKWFLREADSDCSDGPEGPPLTLGGRECQKEFLDFSVSGVRRPWRAGSPHQPLAEGGGKRTPSSALVHGPPLGRGDSLVRWGQAIQNPNPPHKLFLCKGKGGLSSVTSPRAHFPLPWSRATGSWPGSPLGSPVGSRTPLPPAAPPTQTPAPPEN